MFRIQAASLFDQNIFFTCKTRTNNEGITHGCKKWLPPILEVSETTKPTFDNRLTRIVSLRTHGDKQNYYCIKITKLLRPKSRIV